MSEVPFSNAKYFEAEDAKVGIVIFHAYTGTPKDVQLLAGALQREGYTVLVPMYEGHGTPNVKDIVTTNIDRWAEQTYDAVEWMNKQGFEYILTFGLSLGGIYATWAMTQSDLNIDAGGMFNSPVLTSQTVSLERPFRAYTKTIYEHFHSKEEFEQDYDSIVEMHREQMIELDHFKETFQEDVSKIEKPYYIAQSGKDEFIDADRVKYLRDELTNAPVDFNFFPNNTHVITVNRDRKEFEVSLINFIQEVTQA